LIFFKQAGQNECRRWEFLKEEIYCREELVLGLKNNTKK